MMRHFYVSSLKGNQRFQLTTQLSYLFRKSSNKQLRGGNLWVTCWQDDKHLPFPPYAAQWASEEPPRRPAGCHGNANSARPRPATPAECERWSGTPRPGTGPAPGASAWTLTGCTPSPSGCSAPASAPSPTSSRHGCSRSTPAQSASGPGRSPFAYPAPSGRPAAVREESRLNAVLIDSQRTDHNGLTGFGCPSYLVAVYEVEDQVNVSVHRLILSQLRLHSVQPIDQSLQGVRELSGEQKRLLQLVLPAREQNTQSAAVRRTGSRRGERRGRGYLTSRPTCRTQCPICPSARSACRPASACRPGGPSCLWAPALFGWWCRTLSVCCPEFFGTPIKTQNVLSCQLNFGQVFILPTNLSETAIYGNLPIERVKHKKNK